MSQESWEQTKLRLFKSLFIDDAPLSPVVEESESVETRTPSRRLSTASDSSSLPNLIIETEPNRHDDPPEFYERLKEKMIKLWHELPDRLVPECEDVQPLSPRQSLNQFSPGQSLVHFSPGQSLVQFSLGQSLVQPSPGQFSVQGTQSGGPYLVSVESDRQVSESNGYSADAESESEISDRFVTKARGRERSFTDESEMVTTDRLNASNDDDNRGAEYNSRRATETDGAPSLAESSDNTAGYRQITTVAQIHVDSTEMIEKESIIYEESVTSPILPCPAKKRKQMEMAIIAPRYEIEVLDKNDGRDTEGNYWGHRIISTWRHFEEIETMRTPIHRITADSIEQPLEHDSDDTHEYRNNTLEISPMTGLDNSELDSSHDDLVETEGHLSDLHHSALHTSNDDLVGREGHVMSDLDQSEPGPINEDLVETEGHMSDVDHSALHTSNDDLVGRESHVMSGLDHSEPDPSNIRREAHDSDEPMSNCTSRKRKRVESQPPVIAWEDIKNHFFTGTPMFYKIRKMD